jgi:uncharacterized membrane protein YbhN (UPF0104 family)
VIGGAEVADGNRTANRHDPRRALRDGGRRLKTSAVKLALYLLVAYLVVKLIPALKQTLHSLEHVSWAWVLGLIALEVASELGFVLAWGAIIDPQKVLVGGQAGRRMDEHVAWAQLGGGLLLPGGAWGGVGLGVWILHRFGMSTEVITEREFNLSFLNTAVDALALIVFGVGLALGIFAGGHDLLLTVLPPAVAATGIVGALLIAHRAARHAERLRDGHPKVARAITTLANAVDDTERLLFRHGGWSSVLGVLAYFGCDVAVLWVAFFAIHTSPVPGFAVVAMAYIIGALGGSIPLPASIGTVGGIAGMLILYGVGHNAAIAAVLLHQAIGLLVPLTGGCVAYAIIHRSLGPLQGPTGPGRDPPPPWSA